MKFDKHWTQKIIFKPLILRATALAFFKNKKVQYCVIGHGTRLV